MCKSKFCIAFYLILTSLIGPGYGQHADSAARVIEPVKSGKHKKIKEKPAILSPDLSDPAFIDYTDAIIYLSPEESINELAYLRTNFTDQFISVWENPGRIYPASRIFAFSQESRYFRACRFDEQNAVFGQRIVKGEMNLYCCRKQPLEAGLTEFITTDPNNQGYRNFMINRYEGRARFANDFYYFIVMENDSVNPVPVKDIVDFANNYLFDSPEAYAMMMKFDKKKTMFRKLVAPVIVGVIGLATISAGSLRTGLLISSPFIAGGMIYFLLNRDKKGKRPSPEKMMEIVRLYNNKNISK